MALDIVDFETFYDTSIGYTLKKMTTEEYIRDPLFQVIGYSHIHDGGECEWVTGDDDYIRWRLNQIDWANTAMAAHNNRFDAGILGLHYGIFPKFYLDTMSMAMGLVGLKARVSLAALAEFFELPIQKGFEVHNMDGKRREDITPAEMVRYGEYAKDDARICQQLLNILMPRTTKDELHLQDWTIRAFAQPRLVLDGPLLESELAKYYQRRDTLLQRVGVTDVGVLRSDATFAELLQRLGTHPPMKDSPKQKNPDGSPKRVFAFSKQDLEFMDLLDDPDEDVATLVEARLGTKSSMVEGRLKRLIGISRRGPLPVPLNYAGATPTVRWSGDDSINLQNFPRNTYSKTEVDDRGKALMIPSPLRKAICAPPGYKMAAADLSQIELRVNAWQTGQDDVLHILATGGDVYCDQASALAGFTVTKADPVWRFIGKTTELQCFTADTLVLTRRGAVPIVDVTKDDHLWDGVEWVQSEGPVSRGHKAVITGMGLQATADHEVLGLFGWLPLGHRTASTLSRLSARAKAIWSLRGMRYREVLSATLPAAAAAAPSAGPARATGVMGGLPDALRAPGRHRQPPTGLSPANWLGRLSVRMRSSASMAGSRCVDAVRAALSSQSQLATSVAGWPQRPAGAAGARETGNGLTPSSATCARHGGTCATGSLEQRHGWSECTAGSPSTRNGWTSTRSQIRQWACRAGAALSEASFLIGLTVRAVMERTTAGGSTQPPVRETFDLVNAGPRHRFTVIGNGLPLIAHNCGYQCGWAKFQHSLRTAAKREGFVLPDTGDTFCANVVNTYRRKRDRITRNWYVAHEALTPLAFGQTSQLGPYLVRDGVIELPEGHRMYYPNLRMQEKKGDGEQGFEWVYDRFKKGRQTTEKMYGGKLVENITQRVARLFITAAMRRLDEIRYSNGERVFHIVFTVHDEIVVLYHESLDDQYVTETLTWAMTQEMPWAPGMPVACEVGIGRNYSETK